ncbi:MAG: hypothetical protein IKU16_00340, partial [Muribaculaceae bacterium]|nr:hypothetical protein [Muribaculaceae bacterium]
YISVNRWSASVASATTGDAPSLDTYPDRGYTSSPYSAHRGRIVACRTPAKARATRQRCNDSVS